MKIRQLIFVYPAFKEWLFIVKKSAHKDREENCDFQAWKPEIEKKVEIFSSAQW